MVKDLIINSSQKGVEIALLEEKSLVELHKESGSSRFTLRDIYIGQIKKAVAGLNAAFVDVGYEKDAFLHYTDLNPQIKSLMKFIQLTKAGEQNTHLLEDFALEKDIDKDGNVTQAVTKRDLILAQIMKEPISNKGPRLTCNISFPGRATVLTPFSNLLSISKKIKDKEERARLTALMEEIRPANFGVIVRTAAEGLDQASLKADIEDLLLQWKAIWETIKAAKPPTKVFSELNLTSSLMRDLLNESFNKIVINDKSLTGEIKSYIGKIAPEKKNIIEYHGSKVPIFDQYDVTKQIKSSFGQTVTMPSGAYLIIEHTEAMTVIDVNSGNKMGGSIKGNPINNAITVNLESAQEIARQLRLRDIGGIVVIDFIDMKDSDQRHMVYKRIQDAMKEDRARHTILPLSKFCLMQITRQRVKPVIEIATAELCPACEGTGKIRPSLLLLDEIKSNLRYLTQELGFGKLTIVVHPFVEAFFKKGWVSEHMKWSWELKKRFVVATDESLGMTEYHFYDEKGEEIKL